MSKLTFTILAVLCTLLTSCSLSEIESEVINTPTKSIGSNEISTRSLNAIDLSFTTASNNDTSFQCSRIEVTYLNTTNVQLDIDFASSSTVSLIASDVTMDGINQTLAMQYYNGTTFLAKGASVEACKTQICYEITYGTTIGSTSSFIVDEDLSGI